MDTERERRWLIRPNWLLIDNDSLVNHSLNGGRGGGASYNAHIGVA